MSNSLTCQRRKLRLGITQAAGQALESNTSETPEPGSFWLNTGDEQCPSNQGWAFLTWRALLPPCQGTFFSFFNPSPWSGKHNTKPSHEEQYFGFTLTLSSISPPKHHFCRPRLLFISGAMLPTTPFSPLICPASFSITALGFCMKTNSPAVCPAWRLLFSKCGYEFLLCVRVSANTGVITLLLFYTASSHQGSLPQ